MWQVLDDVVDVSIEKVLKLGGNVIFLDSGSLAVHQKISLTHVHHTILENVFKLAKIKANFNIYLQKIDVVTHKLILGFNVIFTVN